MSLYRSGGSGEARQSPLVGHPRVGASEALGNFGRGHELLEIADPGEDVDDRLGFQPGHGGAADMMNAIFDPLADGTSQR